MNPDDRNAQIAERARDEDTEKFHGGDGVEVIEKYTSAMWHDCLPDLILPDQEDESSVLREKISDFLWWQRQYKRSGSLNALSSMSTYMCDIGAIILNNAIKNGLKLEEL